jgi:hypothetical protein
MQQETLSPHQRGLRAYKAQFPQVLGLTLLSLLLRLLAFAPFIYTAITGTFFFTPWPDHALAFSFLCSLPLYLLIVMPCRFHAAACMAMLHGNDREVSMGNYFRWLAAALWRLLRALPFLLPFMAFAAAFYYYMRVPGFNESLQMIEVIGGLLGGSYAAGIALIVLIGLFSALVAAWGWKRGLAFEHQAVVEKGISAAWTDANTLRARRRRHINRTILINALLTLPAVLGVLIVLAIYLGSLSGGMLMLDFVNWASILLTLNFPSSVFYQVLIVLAVLYLPLLPWRKLSLSAVLTQRQEKSV